MASGSFISNTVTSIGSSFPRSIKVACKSTPNIAKNSSIIDYTISTPTGTTTNWVYAYGITVVINGTTVYNITSQTKIYGSKTLKTGSLTIPHNADGKQTINVSIRAKLYYSTENSTGGGNMTLDTIARASSIRAAMNKTLDNACSISWTPASSSFTYSLKLSLNSWSDTIQNIKPARTTSYTYTGYPIPLEVASHLPDTTTGTMTAILYTYSGSTLIGTSSKTFTVTVPSTVVPTLSTPSVTIDNSSNKVVKSWNVAVAGYTKATITTTASPVYNSTITNFTISGGYSTTQTGQTNLDGTKKMEYTGEFLTSGSKTFTVTAKDSRDRTSNAKHTSAITVYDYAKPSITTFTVMRDSADASKVIAKAKWNYSSVNNHNNIKNIILEYKKASATDWTEYTGDLTNITNSTGIKLSITGGFVTNSSYNFRISISDALNTSLQKTASISSQKVTMDFQAGGEGVSIGKRCENVKNEKGNITSGGFQVAFDTRFYENIYRQFNNKFIAIPRIACGKVTITPIAANTPTKVAITFPEGLFSTAPTVTVTPHTSVPGTGVTGVGIINQTKDGCEIYLTRTGTSATTVSWQAIEVPVEIET